MSNASAPTLLAEEAQRAAYRDYDKPGIDRVRDFYRNNHLHQTFDFVLRRRLSGCSSTTAR